MDKFESQFSDLDVQTSYMESTMSDTTALTTPQDQVDSLINQVADEAGLEVEHGLGVAQVPNAVPAQQVVEKEAPLEEDGRLAERLRALRVSGQIHGSVANAFAHQLYSLLHDPGRKNLYVVNGPVDHLTKYPTCHACDTSLSHKEFPQL